MPVPKSEDRKLWHRLPGETSKQYQRFTAFLAMGPGRTYVAVQKSMNVGRVAIETVASQHSWLERAAAYDQEGATNFLQDIEDVRTEILNDILGKAPEYLRVLDDIAHGRLDDDEESSTDEDGLPIVKPSTRLQAAIKGLELAGFVPPKRESRTHSDEALDAARVAVKDMDTEKLQELLEVLNRGKS